MFIKQLHLENVGVFDAIDFDFDPHVNLFVGPNNTGKSTALFALADIAVHPFSFPRKHVRQGASFTVTYGATPSNITRSGPLPIFASRDEEGYWNEARFQDIRDIQAKLGYSAYVPALRVGTDYRSKGPVIEKPEPEVYARFGRTSEAKQQRDVAASYIRDATIVQDLIALDYQAYRENNPAIRKTVELVASIGSRITEGFPVKFAGVDEDKDGLFPVFHTPDGKVALGALSQGTQGLLLWLTYFIIGYARAYNFPRNFDRKPAVLIVDEIDAHLHPSWQRRIIPEIRAEFPALQIFCSTHSPLMIAGLERGQVHLLQRNRDGTVAVSRNETDVKGWSADEIYNSFLDIENPTDVRTDAKVDRLEILRGKRRLTSSEKRELQKLRLEVSALMKSRPDWDEEVRDAASELTDAVNRAAKNGTASRKSKGKSRG